MEKTQSKKGAKSHVGESDNNAFTTKIVAKFGIAKEKKEDTKPEAVEVLQPEAVEVLQPEAENLSILEATKKEVAVLKAKLDAIETTKKEAQKKRPAIDVILSEVEKLNELTKQHNNLLTYKDLLIGLDFENSSNAKLSITGTGYNKELVTSNSFLLEGAREYLLLKLEKRLLSIQNEISLKYAQIADPEALPF